MKIPGYNALKLIKKKYDWGHAVSQNKFHLFARQKLSEENLKKPIRTDVINFILSKFDEPTTYLEIGVRNPNDNFRKINATKKYSVDPGYENAENDVDFKMTSDEFFTHLKNSKVLHPDIKFDVIFIDGSHLADQVDRDIENSLTYLKNDGYIIMHDCNPPTAFHASEYYDYHLSPAGTLWNGTTWKAFFKARKREDIFSCCIDTDWGIGIISKTKKLGIKTNIENNFFEYRILDETRTESLNLITFEELKKIIA